MAAVSSPKEFTTRCPPTTASGSLAASARAQRPKSMATRPPKIVGAWPAPSGASSPGLRCPARSPLRELMPERSCAQGPKAPLAHPGPGCPLGTGLPPRGPQAAWSAGCGLGWAKDGQTDPQSRLLLSALPPLTCSFTGSPNGVRTRVSTLRGWCPRPLDDGASGASLGYAAIGGPAPSAVATTNAPPAQLAEPRGLWCGHLLRGHWASLPCRLGWGRRRPQREGSCALRPRLERGARRRFCRHCSSA
jgi:hypothetical protein